ncbi:hypothetical protein Bca4012_033684 [Brassica carinata]|uniref:Uncharacterized protein n=2 Tax=Brassica TaxID=3705 RepID=A0A3P6D0X8_BRAOL|nr:unnamed protein product [Brassica napus]CDY15378.1 BnaC04g42450D [Brassica napus]VDD14342.1 unnamed protein product [Brassica oleracea]
MNVALKDGDKWMFTGHEVHVLDTPGQNSHINFGSFECYIHSLFCIFLFDTSIVLREYESSIIISTISAYTFQDHELSFSGDTLFSLSCGKLFEGTRYPYADACFSPKDYPYQMTQAYIASDVKFALSIEPNNEVLVLCSSCCRAP